MNNTNGPQDNPLELLTEKELAKVTGFSPRTLQSWRCRGLGPPFLKISQGCIRYQRAEVEKWLASRWRRSTSDYPEISGVV